MNFVPRAVAKKTAKSCVAVKRKVTTNPVKTSNVSQSSSTSTSAPPTNTLLPNQLSAENREYSGKDCNKSSEVSSISGLEDKGFSVGEKCPDKGASSYQTPADVEKLPSLSSHSTGQSPLAKHDASVDGSEDTCGRNSDRTHTQSHENKLERLQELSDRISSQVSAMKENQSTGHGESTNLTKPAAYFVTYDEAKRWSHQDHHVHQDSPDDEDSESEEEPPPIVSFSKNQRWPEDDEPVCVVCGKYGEYICNQTEADVCSLECKAKNLVRRGLQPNVPQANKPADDTIETSSSSQDATEDSVIQGEAEKPYIYQEHPDISQLTAEQVQDIRNEVQIFVEGMNVPRPILEFEQLCLPSKLQSNLHSSDYVTPTPIQMQAIPASLALRDLMMCAQTSSGKTLSFLVPAVITIYNQVVTGDGSNGPFVLILTPTRELAMQIEEQAKQLMKGMSSMKTALLVGGLPLPPQLHRLRQGIQIIVGTPGRILEIIRQEGVSLREMKIVVTDEVDTLLQMGFQQQVYDIMTHLPDNHQTIFTSATIPSSIEKMASTLLNNPVFISVGTPSTPCTSVKQVILWVEEPSKKKKLFAILQDPKHFKPPAIVFVDSKLGADLLAQAVEKSCGVSVASLHGDKPQSQRNEILQRFRDGAYDVMISTAVLGRGIDLPGVKMVINFDMPGTVEEYIHQIGRTGRLGTTGTAMTFINNNSKKFFNSAVTSQWGLIQTSQEDVKDMTYKGIQLHFMADHQRLYINAQLFLQFTSTLKPLGVTLPPELINSPHLSYHRQQHRSRDRQMDASRRMPGGSGYHRSKRSRDRESVTDILKKRKRSSSPEDTM